jgi:hypothetical protein
MMIDNFVGSLKHRKMAKYFIDASKLCNIKAAARL